VIGVIGFGAALVPLSWLYKPIVNEHVAVTLLYIAVGTQIAALRPIPWKTGTQSVVDPLLIASGLLAPGFGVGLVSWLATYDGRLPGRRIPWWAFLFNRAQWATAHVIPSLVVNQLFPGDGLLPVKAVAYIAATVALNYVVIALAVSAVNRGSFWFTLLDNVGLRDLGRTLLLNSAGAILYVVLENPVGYFIAPGLFGFVIVMRSAIADVQRQTALKNQTLELAAQALDNRDRYTELHSVRVSEMAARLAEQLDLGDRDVERIKTAGALHDLGKIGVRDYILDKPGPLNDEEWRAMERHSDLGADMIAQHDALAEVAPYVRHHHERWDGTGYPAGLKADAIPFGARILSVADSFDTITGPRLYRLSHLKPIEAVEDISRRANHWYDPNVVDALREMHGLPPMEVANRPPVPRRITTLRVIRSNPGFSNLITAIGISSAGDPLTQVATLVTIYAATGKASLVALGFITQALGTVLISAVLGGVVDKLPRRGLVVTLETIRGALLIATPFLLGLAALQHDSLQLASSAPRWWLIIPILFCLACINAVVQPARQAAIPTLVPSTQVGKANAIVTATTMVASAIGFAFAGLLWAVFNKPGPLFVADAATFLVAAAIVLGIPSLGGGVVHTKLAGALGRSWSVVAARSHLVVGGLASFLLPISFPALLAMAYQMAGTKSGGELYSALELVLSLGVVAGSLLVARFGAIGTMSTVGGGLVLTGGFSIFIWLSLWQPFGSAWSVGMVAFFLFVASVGNPIYAVANQTAILEAADPSNRGSLMATRFGLVQTASIVGTAVGGFITQLYSPEAAYGVLGVGLVLLASYALASGRTAAYDPFGRAKT